MNEESWHLDKRISLGHMITTMAFVVSGVIYVGDLEREIVKHGEQITAMQQRIDRDAAQIDKRLSQMIHLIENNSKKLDRLIERELDDIVRHQ